MCCFWVGGNGQAYMQESDGNMHVLAIFGQIWCNDMVVMGFYGVYNASADAAALVYTLLFRIHDNKGNNNVLMVMLLIFRSGSEM